MNHQKIRELAAYHESQAAASFELAKHMLGPAEENFRRRGALHLDWSQELRALLPVSKPQPQ